MSHPDPSYDPTDVLEALTDEHPYHPYNKNCWVCAQDVELYNYHNKMAGIGARIRQWDKSAGDLSPRNLISKGMK